MLAPVTVAGFFEDCHSLSFSVMASSNTAECLGHTDFTATSPLPCLNLEHY